MSTFVESAMGESGVLVNDVAAGPIDWDLVFPNIPDDPSLFDPSVFSDLSDSPDCFSMSIGDLERLLMGDDDNKAIGEQQPLEFSDDFLADLLLDTPVESDRSAVVVDLMDGGQISNSSSPGVEVDGGKIDSLPLDSPVESDRSAEVYDLPDGGKISNSSSSADEEDQGKIDGLSRKDIMNNNIKGDGDNSDPINKKQQRQLRNRDAAVRSRERRKMYVRDLEIKSRYLEGECRRLGMLLQCCSAENQALRLSLHNAKAFDASMSKQESAVLLLESLLLGSLLWFMGIVCLFLARPFQLNLEAVPPGNVDEKNQGRPAPRKAENKTFGLLQEFQSFMVSKRCKASRSRMKPKSLMLEVLVRLS